MELASCCAGAVFRPREPICVSGVLPGVARSCAHCGVGPLAPVCRGTTLKLPVTSCTCRAVLSDQQFRPSSLSYHHHPLNGTSPISIMSLLQDVLRTQTLDSLDKALASGRNSPDDDDELVNVVSRYFCARWFSPRFSQLLHNLPYHSSRCLSPAVLEGRALARGQRLAPTRPPAVPGLALSIRFPP